jgi:hypothetical protein
MSNNWYEIKPVPGKGLGMVAARWIPKGTRILSEKALFKFPHPTTEMEEDDIIIRDILDGLTKQQRDAFFALYNPWESEYLAAVRIAQNNGMPLASDSSLDGLFLVAARINHDCVNNAHRTWRQDREALHLHAIRNIAEGEEITISYTARFRTFEERQTFLLGHPMFTCTCTLCSLPRKQREESDKRMMEMRLLETNFEGDYDIDDTSLRTAHKLYQLMREEFVYNAKLVDIYEVAQDICVEYRDFARASVFAQKTIDARIISEGEDSPRVRAARLMMARMYKHGMNHIPEGLSESAFETWLWDKK